MERRLHNFSVVTGPWTRQEAHAMNRKLNTLIRATLVAMPLALPTAALAQSQSQSQGGSMPSDTPSGAGSYGNTRDSNQRDTSGAAPSAQPMDNTENKDDIDSSHSKSKNDVNPPSGSMDTSGSTGTSDRNIGGDVNKGTEESTSSTTSMPKKQHKQSKRSTDTTDKK
jgi:hypothetical protein